MLFESRECEEDTRIRNMVRQHYYRNRHLTSVHDDDDLFQEAWIHLNSPEPGTAGGHNQTEEHSETDQASQDKVLQRAVRRAASRAFGKLRKRQVRGTATETALEFDPSDSLPDSSLVIDLRNQIESLPSDERLIIKLLRCGYDGIEIAALLGLSPQAVSRRKQKAIETLRRVLVQS